MHGLHFWCGRVLATEVNTDDGRAMKLFIVLVGVKGDWVYLRIWFAKWGLALGYVSVRVYRKLFTCVWAACMRPLRQSSCFAERVHQHSEVSFLFLPWTLTTWWARYSCRGFIFHKLARVFVLTCASEYVQKHARGVIQGLVWHETHCCLEARKALDLCCSRPTTQLTFPPRRAPLWEPSGPDAHVAPWSRQRILFFKHCALSNQYCFIHGCFIAFHLHAWSTYLHARISRYF